MDLEQVMARVRLMTEDDREALLMTLCTDAIRMLESRLTCTAEERAAYEPALCAAAAALAVYQLVLLEEASAPDSVTAGDVRAEYGNGSTRALEYCRQCMKQVSPILRDDAFYFGGVRPCETR